jgi:hypothetical protein
MRLIRFLIVPALSAIALLGAFAVTDVPTDIQMPGTQQLEPQNLQSVNKCDNCHGNFDPVSEPAGNWRGSMMAQAGRDPIFWATMAVAEQDFPGAGDLCLRCHASDGWFGGRSIPTDGSALSSNDGDGVTCDFCHRMTNPDTSEWLGVQNAPFLAHDGGDPPVGYYGNGMSVIWPDTNEKFGPYDDAVPNHGFFGSDFHRSSELCGSCHDVSNPVVGDLAHNNGAQVPLQPGTFSGVPGSPVEGKAAFNNFPFAYGVVERTFSEHQASAFATMPVADYPSLPNELKAGSIQRAYDAAMASNPPTGNYVDGDLRTFSCQACHMPPVTGKGCNKASAPVRADLPQHDMTGGNYWIPDAIEFMDDLGQLVLGGGLNAAQITALQNGKARALTMLEDAAALEGEDDELKVINLTGHKLISGYPEGRRMWLNVKWYDAGLNLLREDGEYGAMLAEIDGVPTIVDSILQLDPPDTRIYEAHYAMTQEWAGQLLSLGYPAGMPLTYDRETGTVADTLGDLGAQAPGTYLETFHFVLNNTVVSDNRIPPYGFDYDEAAKRNALPVPASQYGGAGPGQVFEHYDEVQLSPPPGATSATIDLLYQPTSWEYIQFLDLANDGSETFLADTGRDMLDAWLATGMAAPHVMASTTWTGVGPADPWTDLGFGLAGVSGIPDLDGNGTLVAGTPGSLTLTDAAPAAPALLFLSFNFMPVPFKGGQLVTVPVTGQYGLLTGTGGSLELPWLAWPSGLPSGLSMYFQYAIQDAAGVQGVSLSTALQATMP